MNNAWFIGIETCLDKMTRAWRSVTLRVEPFKDTGTGILKGIEEYTDLLDDQITMTQAMACSVFKGKDVRVVVER